MRESPAASLWKVKTTHSHFHDPQPCSRTTHFYEVNMPLGIWPKKIRWNLSLSTEKLHKWLCEAAIGWWINQRLGVCLYDHPGFPDPKAYPQARKQPSHQSSELSYSLVQQKSKKAKTKKTSSLICSFRLLRPTELHTSKFTVSVPF